MSDLINFVYRSSGGGSSSGSSTFNITEISHPLKQLHIRSCHDSSAIADCIECRVYCQLKYSMKMLKHFCSILQLQIILYIIYTHSVSCFCVQLRVTLQQKQIVCAAVQMYSAVRMSIAAIAIVTNSLSAVPLALLHSQ